MNELHVIFEADTEFLIDRYNLRHWIYGQRLGLSPDPSLNRGQDRPQIHHFILSDPDLGYRQPVPRIWPRLRRGMA